MYLTSYDSHIRIPYKRKTIRNMICDLITLDQLYCTSVSLMSVEMFPFIFWSLVKIFPLLKYNLECWVASVVVELSLLLFLVE